MSGGLTREAPICFYGLYAWLNADYLLREHADYAIGGEAEQALLALAQALETGDDAPVPGVSERRRRRRTGHRAAGPPGAGSSGLPRLSATPG